MSCVGLGVRDQCWLAQLAGIAGWHNRDAEVKLIGEAADKKQ